MLASHQVVGLQEQHGPAARGFLAAVVPKCQACSALSRFLKPAASSLLLVLLLHHRPGHVLISPVRVVQRFAELTPEEVSDLWGLAQLVGKTLEPHYKASSLTLAIQVRLYVCVYTGRLHPTC